MGDQPPKWVIPWGCSIWSFRDPTAGEVLLPGFAALFVDIWQTPAALAVAWHFSSPEAIRGAGPPQLAQHLAAGNLRCRHSTLERITAWAGIGGGTRAAAPPKYWRRSFYLATRWK